MAAAALMCFAWGVASEGLLTFLIFGATISLLMSLVLGFVVGWPLVSALRQRNLNGLGNYLLAGLIPSIGVAPILWGMNPMLFPWLLGAALVSGPTAAGVYWSIERPDRPRAPK